jgi:CDGSH iron-sulfur domain-containing protein 3
MAASSGFDAGGDGKTPLRAIDTHRAAHGEGCLASITERHKLVAVHSGGALMTSPIVAQKSPYPIEVKSSETYYWCACGRSKKQPFCDGSHAGTRFLPKPYRPEKDGTAWFCGCKHSQKSPLCDGSHARI